MQATNTNPENTLELPAPIALYLAVDKANDIEGLSTCFVSNAHVHDESHDYHGLEAIQNWKREAQEKYRYTVEPLEASVNGDTVQLHARVTGDFPGSPVELDYTFTLADNKITKLEIH